LPLTKLIVTYICSKCDRTSWISWYVRRFHDWRVTNAVCV